MIIKTDKTGNIISLINLDEILQQVFDLFGVNYLDVDCDAALILRKLTFVFLKKAAPDCGELLRVRRELNYLKDSFKIYI